jgi:hypothetical protein
MARLPASSSTPEADARPEAPALGALCVGEAGVDGEGEADVCEGDGDGLLVGLGGGALIGGAGACASLPASPVGSTGVESPSGEVSGALARMSSGSAPVRLGVS